MGKKANVAVLLITMLLLAACGQTPPITTNPSPGQENTQPAASATAPSMAPSATPAVTQAASQQPTSDSAPCNSAKFVSDVSIPDDTVINPGAAFTKTWRLENNGACTWTIGYSLVFSNGDLMGGPITIQFSSAINPGDTVDLSVNLVAPTGAGTYQGNWKLSNETGTLFGTGPFADQPFWVKIVVNNP